MSDSSRKVPELSLLSYVEGSQQDQAKFVLDLFNGIKDYGFIILTDHTVQDDVIQKGYKAVEDFFSLPDEKKKEYICKEGGGQRGYTPFGTEHAKDNPHMDLKEFWHVGREVSDDHPFNKYYPKNVWPQEIAGFKTNLENLYNELDKTSHILLEALGKALDVENDYFAKMIDTGNSILRAIHYPPVGEAPPVGSVRAAAHGDINLITILMGATASGLQLLDRDGTWLDVETKPGQLVVDSGDMMSRITNDVIPATIHRVINPEDSGSARYSMPFFVHPHPEAMLRCIPSCEGAGAKYPPITAHDCLMERLKDIGLM
ncbi:MAG: 2-oxoglutarate and iron-dependent oxygenase domain-containing protein [Bacteriovoracaceae bacterium]|jgi:isopenicillin N synthase-like dioxygenase|nr:2-oxoglutarate and iron-dependent oxygenase domain-containing protein [Bacteriovoracaceae bacterium]